MNYSQKIDVLNGFEARNENERSAEVTGHSSGISVNESATSQPGKHRTKVAPKQPAGIWEPRHRAFLDQHIYLNENTKAEAAYDFINLQLKEELNGGYENFRTFPDEMKTIGYFLDETREGCYRIQLFNFEGKIGVNCTRLDGDSLAVCALWASLKLALHDQNFYFDKFLEEAEDDEEIFGEDDEDLDMDAFKYLDFSRDEAFVSKMVDDISDANVGTHSLMLLKFNLEKENNLELVSEKFAQRLFDNTVECLSKPTVSIPDVVCASHIIAAMVTQAAINVTIEQLENIFEAAENWCFESHSSRTVIPDSCNEGAFTLIEAMEGVSGVHEREIQDKIQSISEKTDFDNVRDVANNLLASN